MFYKVLFFLVAGGSFLNICYASEVVSVHTDEAEVHESEPTTAKQIIKEEETSVHAQESTSEPISAPTLASTPEPTLEQVSEPTPEQVAQPSSPESESTQATSHEAKAQEMPASEHDTEVSAQAVPPAIPEPAKPEAVSPEPELETESEEEQLNLDTIDSEERRGNWVRKRVYWERAAKVYESISGQLQDVAGMSPRYFQKRTELDRDLNKFYVTEGIGLGELKELITTSLEGLEDVQKQRGSLDEESRDLAAKLQNKEKALKRLDQQVDIVLAIDKALDEDLIMLEKQIGQARGYERQAWDAFKEISRELSDKRARSIYYSMRTMKKNVGSIDEYLSGALDDHFNQLIKMARDRVSEIQKSISELRTEGIDLRSYAKKLTQTESCPLQTNEESSEHEDEEMPQKQESYIGRIWHGVTGTIGGIIGWFLSWFGY